MSVITLSVIILSVITLLILLIIALSVLTDVMSPVHDNQLHVNVLAIFVQKVRHEVGH